jgi:hypothetical protein
MSYIQNIIVLFICFLVLTAFCSYIGDDDVVYQFLERKPTPREGLIRIRWVLLKTFTSLFGGMLLAFVLGKIILEKRYSVHLSPNQAVLLALACVCVAGLMIGVLENEIRRLCGRQRRPLVDVAVLKHNWRLRRGR